MKAFPCTTLCASPEDLKYFASDRGVFKGTGSHLKKRLTRDWNFPSSRTACRGTEERGAGLGRGLGGARHDEPVRPRPSLAVPMPRFLIGRDSRAGARRHLVPSAWAGKGFRLRAPPSLQVVRSPQPPSLSICPRVIKEAFRKEIHRLSSERQGRNRLRGQSLPQDKDLIESQGI